MILQMRYRKLHTNGYKAKTQQYERSEPTPKAASQYKSYTALNNKQLETATSRQPNINPRLQAAKPANHLQQHLPNEFTPTRREPAKPRKHNKQNAATHEQFKA